MLNIANRAWTYKIYRFLYLPYKCRFISRIWWLKVKSHIITFMRRKILTWLSPFMLLYLLLIGLNVYRFMSGGMGCSYYYSAGGAQDIPGCFDLNALPKNIVFFFVLFVLLIVRFIFFTIVKKIYSLRKSS